MLAAAHRDGGNVVTELPGPSMALAANVYAREAGLPLTTLLYDQTQTRGAQNHLRLFQQLGAELIAVQSLDEGERKLQELEKSTRKRFGHGLFNLNPSEPPGMLGYVNAAFELREQVSVGDLPEPDLIYLPLGLLGTSTGLWLGLKAAGLNTRVVSVYNQPVDEIGAGKVKEDMIALFDRCRDFIIARAPDFPWVSLRSGEILLRAASPAKPASLADSGKDWIPRFKAIENISLEATWSAPTLAALALDLEKKPFRDLVILFWFTPNTRAMPAGLEKVDYRRNSIIILKRMNRST